MSHRNWVVIATAALLLTPYAASQERSGQLREGVRLPILGQDREPIDLLNKRPEEVERALRQRIREDSPNAGQSKTLASSLQPLPGIDPGLFDLIPAPEEEQVEERAAQQVEVKGIWIAESHAGEGTIPAEMELANNSKRAHSLTYVYTDAAEEAILHVTQWIAGVQYAQRLKELYLPPNQRVHLRAGGPRLLLVDLRRPLSSGDAISVTLQFADGSRKTVRAPVQSFN